MRKLNEPVASLPPPEKSGGASSLQTRLAALIGELRRAARKTGVDVDGPLGPVLSALILVLEWLGACLAELRQITVEYGNQALQRRQADRAADEAATARLRTQMAAVRLEIVHDFQADIARDVDKLMVRRVHLAARNSGLVAAAVLVGGIAGSLTVGYGWGHGNAEAAIHQTEGRLIAAFQYGVTDAFNWAGLMSWNDITVALDQCKKQPNLAYVQHNRHACNVPLWIEQDEGGPDVVIDDVIAESLKLREQARAREQQEQAGADSGPPLKPGAAPQHAKPSR